MIKVLVLGASGMLGHMVMEVLQRDKKLEVSGTCFNDPRDPWYFNAETGAKGLERICLAENPFHYIINCIGTTKDKIREEDSRSVLRAIAVNAAWPHELADFVRARDIRIMHISTDGVFANLGGEIEETRPFNCADIYGQTKSLGEIKTNPRFLNIRCSIFGPSPLEGGGLLEWFLQQPENTEIKGFNNHRWKGVSTLQFAQLCRKIIREELFDRLRQESGIFHFVPNQTVSKYELLNIFKAVFDKQIDIIPAEDRQAVNRTLATRYDSLKSLFASEIPMPDVVRELRDFMGSEAYQNKIKRMARVKK